MGVACHDEWWRGCSDAHWRKNSRRSDGFKSALQRVCLQCGFSHAKSEGTMVFARVKEWSALLARAPQQQHDLRRLRFVESRLAVQQLEHRQRKPAQLQRTRRH